MEETLEKMRLHLGNPEKYTKYELEFHRAVIEAAGNRVIADLMEKLYKLLKETRARIYQKYSFKIRAYRDQDYKNHMTICSAIKAGDAQTAAKAMADHLLDFERDSETNTTSEASHSTTCPKDTLACHLPAGRQGRQARTMKMDYSLQLHYALCSMPYATFLVEENNLR